MDTSPEIKLLVNKLCLTKTGTNQAKYEEILERKRYDHYCFFECIRLRLDKHRGTDTVSNVQVEADRNFEHMLAHTHTHAAK
jgi:hypothetical protein